jgi:hypothetical protein
MEITTTHAFLGIIGIYPFTNTPSYNAWKDLHKLAIKLQRNHKIGGSTNSAFLALIPKEKGALTFHRFCLISLCNIGHKIITKLIANRLKGILPTIILENQGGFIKGRQITDNIILVQEAIHSSMH